MRTVAHKEFYQVLGWLESTLGQVEVLSDRSKVHGDHVSGTFRLLTAAGVVYVKIHESSSHWHSEVHAYERWASAFGRHAPRLLAVRDQVPLALVLSELPGKVMDDVFLTSIQEEAIWETAGKALRALHECEQGQHFGACLRDGTVAERGSEDANEHVLRRMMGQKDHASGAGLLTHEESATLDAAISLVSAFDGEKPVPCHRDFCTANWLIDADGSWAGIIDFEFSRWDVRVSDFSRYPNWTWIDRPDLIEALFQGYGLSVTKKLEQQLLIAHAEYALSAIIWGRENSFFGFEREGRESLAHLARILA